MFSDLILERKGDSVEQGQDLRESELDIAVILVGDKEGAHRQFVLNGGGSWDDTGSLRGEQECRVRLMDGVRQS